jgi:glutamate---cysteine ligase / carboxylate-amine ligase
MPEFTLGVEEELHILDPVSRNMIVCEHNIITEGDKLLPNQVKHEMHQAVVEVTSPVCRNIQEVRESVTKMRKTIIQLAEQSHFAIAASATHPFAQWSEQAITDLPRYKDVVDELQDAARSNLIFGLHVHVGIPNRKLCVDLMNAARYFLPHIFALSTSSPFWKGRNTGFKSYRTKVFDKFPRTGIPDYFSSIGEFDDYVDLLVKTNCIDNAKKIWWDIRVHPFYPTIEFRICDIPHTIDETVAITALIQAVVATLYRLKQRNLNFRLYSRALINENKWRAARYGIEGKLIDFGKEAEVPAKALIYELLSFVDNVVEDLGSRTELNHIHEILKNGTSADRQLAVYEKTHDLKAVVDFIIAETKKGIDFSD